MEKAIFGDISRAPATPSLALSALAALAASGRTAKQQAERASFANPRPYAWDGRMNTSGATFPSAMPFHSPLLAQQYDVPKGWGSVRSPACRDTHPRGMAEPQAGAATGVAVKLASTEWVGWRRAGGRCVSRGRGYTIVALLTFHCAMDGSRATMAATRSVAWVASYLGRASEQRATGSGVNREGFRKRGSGASKRGGGWGRGRRERRGEEVKGVGENGLSCKFKGGDGDAMHFCKAALVDQVFSRLTLHVLCLAPATSDVTPALPPLAAPPAPLVASLSPPILHHALLCPVASCSLPTVPFFLPWRHWYLSSHAVAALWLELTMQRVRRGEVARATAIPVVARSRLAAAIPSPAARPPLASLLSDLRRCVLSPQLPSPSHTSSTCPIQCIGEVRCLPHHSTT
ncbi:unnamed protein product [Closterium sp. Naga37s-1]|nr:unnamed protein product [Closterium sp. Naga37s-1]